MKDRTMRIDRKAAEEDFDNFLMVMDEQLEWLETEARHTGITLHDAPDVPETLELLLGRMASGLNDDAVSRLLVVFGRYLGEYVRTRYGGTWTLPLDDEKNVNFNVPVITGHTPMPELEFAPIRVMRAYYLRRRAGTLRRAIDSHITPERLDLSDLIEQEHRLGGAD